MFLKWNKTYVDMFCGELQRSLWQLSLKKLLYNWSNLFPTLLVEV